MKSHKTKNFAISKISVMMLVLALCMSLIMPMSCENVYADNEGKSVASEENRETADGEKNKETVAEEKNKETADGEKSKTATNIRDYFHKGKGIVVSGRMENDPYTDKDGRLRESWAIKVERWEFMIQDPKHDTAGPKRAPEPSAPNAEPFTPDGDTFEAAEDDIPF